MNKTKKSATRQDEKASRAVNQEESVQFMQQHYQGLVPPAFEMQSYYDIDPDIPKQIMIYANREAVHRHQLETKELEVNTNIVTKQLSERKRGQIFGFLIGSLGLSCSVLLAFLESHTAAGIVGGSTVLGLVGIFVTGQLLSKEA